MRSLEEIDRDLAAAGEALSHAEGTPAEVYSRIVGYYRSVRNWNKGKREEYGERKLFCLPENSAKRPVSGTLENYAADTVINAAFGTTTVGMAAGRAAATSIAIVAGSAVTPAKSAVSRYSGGVEQEERLLLFVRPACPSCPGAKTAAGKLGIPVDLVNADTADGMAEAVKRQVFSIPTAILLAHDGKELGRALDAGSIGRLAAV
jgi:ribonucleoside-triphosphate reductase